MQINLVELIWRKNYIKILHICKFQPLKQQYVYERLNILYNFVVQDFCKIILSVCKEPVGWDTDREH